MRKFLRRIQQYFRGPTSSTTLVPLPFYVPQQQLPDKIPTVATIEASGEILTERSAVKVVAVGKFFVIKYGKGVELDEGRTMLYLQNHSNVRVPIVYAVFQKSGQNFIVMERIHGPTLEEMWPALGVQQKNDISRQLKAYINDMRKLTSPAAFCSLGRAPLRDNVFWMKLKDGTSGYNGPFNSHAELLTSLIDKYRTGALSGKANYYQSHLPKVLDKHAPTFSHADLQRKNIIIRAHQTSKAGWEVVLIDWESAGWYPACWEYAQAIIACGFFDDDWHEWISKFLVPFPDEYAWINMLFNEIG